MNARIREMVTNIVEFMQNDALQKVCKGTWALIETQLKSSLLSEILIFQEKPRNELTQILKQLIRSECKLKILEERLMVTTDLNHQKRTEKSVSDH